MPRSVSPHKFRNNVYSLSLFIRSRKTTQVNRYHLTQASNIMHTSRHAAVYGVENNQVE